MVKKCKDFGFNLKVMDKQRSSSLKELVSKRTQILKGHNLLSTYHVWESKESIVIYIKIGLQQKDHALDLDIEAKSFFNRKFTSS